MDRARRDFGVSVAEVDDQDLWNSAVVGIVCVGNEVAHVESVLGHALALFETHPEVEVEDAAREIGRR